MLVLNVLIYTSPLWAILLLSHYYGFWVLMEMLPYLGYVLAAVVGIVVLVVIVAGGFALYGVASEKLTKKTVEDSGDNSSIIPKKKPLSFTKMLLQYLSDKHGMFCRQIDPVIEAPITTEAEVGKDSVENAAVTHTDDSSTDGEVSSSDAEIITPTPKRQTASAEQEDGPAMYVEITHKVSFTFGKMFVSALVIALAAWILWESASSMASDQARVPREKCRVLSSEIVGYGETSSKGSEVTVHAACSFGEVVETRKSVSTTLAFAINKPTELQCFQKKYEYTSVRGCDMPK